MTSAGATSLVTGLSRHHSSFLQDPRSRPRPASPPRLPPHPRRHLGPPDRGHGLPGRSPLPPGHHRDQHRQDRAQATRPTGGHHQPQRPPNHCSAPAHPNRNQHPQIPQALRTLRHQESGQGSRPQPSLLAEPLDKDLQAPAPSWPPTPGSLPSHAAPAHRSAARCVSHGGNKRLKRAMFPSAFASLALRPRLPGLLPAQTRPRQTALGQAVLALAHRRIMTLHAMIPNHTLYTPQPSTQPPAAA